MKTVSLFRSVFFTFLFSSLLQVNCSAQDPQPVQLKVKVTVDGITNTYDVPVSVPVELGKTYTVEAVIPSPFVFLKWSGDLTGTDNPYTGTFTKPALLKIEYSTTLAYEIIVDSALFTDKNNFEFDVSLKSKGVPFKVTAFQVALAYKETAMKGTGTLTFSYVTGTKEVPNEISGAGIYRDTENSNIAKLAFASSPNSEGVTISNNTIKLGRFRLTNTVEFADYDPNLLLNYNGHPATIITGENFSDITVYAQSVNAGSYLAFLSIVF